jgi:glycosyltransferase involved in cell wall biosynthesis
MHYPINMSSVTHILYSGLGGHSAVLFALLEARFMSGINHHILFIGIESPPVDYVRRCSSLGVSWDYLPKTSGKNNLSFQFSLFKKILTVKPDILFLHGVAAVPAVVLLKIFRPKGFVLVRETQANDLKTAMDWVLLATAYQMVDRVVHLTNEAAQGTLKRLGFLVRKNKVSIISNGLDTDFYSPVSDSAATDEIIHIGMQSRLQPNKDHITLIKAFALICAHYPDKCFHLHIAGDGSTYSDILDMIHLNNISEVTTLHGILGQIDLCNLLRGLDIYVHCTHGETMSTAIMQALSCGLPVVASNVPGVSNMVTADAGMLYDPGDANDLADKLRVLIECPEERMQWKKKARAYALKYFSVSATVRAYETLLFPHTQY